MKNNMKVPKIPEGKKMEWVNGVLTLVDIPEKYKYQVIVSGTILADIYTSEGEAEAKAKELGGMVVKMKVESAKSTLRLSLPHFGIRWDWVVAVIGLLLLAFGFYKMMTTDNDAGSWSLVRIIAVMVAGAVLAVGSLWRRG